MKPRNVRKVRPRIAAAVCLAVYSVCLLYWMFLGFGRSGHRGGPMLYNLVPFRTIGYYLSDSVELSLTARLVNLAGNVAVFVPVGLLLSLASERLRSAAALALLFIPCITALETLQMLLRAGSFDVDDILLNLVGVLAGFVLLRLSRITRRRR